MFYLGIESLIVFLIHLILYAENLILVSNEISILIFKILTVSRKISCFRIKTYKIN